MLHAPQQFFGAPLVLLAAYIAHQVDARVRYLTFTRTELAHTLVQGCLALETPPVLAPVITLQAKPFDVLPNGLPADAELARNLCIANLGILLAQLNY